MTLLPIFISHLRPFFLLFYVFFLPFLLFPFDRFHSGCFGIRNNKFRLEMHKVKKYWHIINACAYSVATAAHEIIHMTSPPTVSKGKILSIFREFLLFCLYFFSLFEKSIVYVRKEYICFTHSLILYVVHKHTVCAKEKGKKKETEKLL